MLYKTTLKNSNNYGHLSYTGSQNFVGGIAAWFRDAGTRTVTNVMNFGDIDTTGDEVGGLVGYCSDNTGAIANVDGFVNIGTIVANSYVGAFAGNTKKAYVNIVSSINLGKASNPDLIHNGLFGATGANTTYENCLDYMA